MTTAMAPHPRFMIAAAHKSSGKTVISTGLVGALSRATPVSPFKKGPDYIDPMWLSAASGTPCYNLDFNTMERDAIAPFFTARAAALSLIEANKGLYDGVKPDGSDSNAALAKLLNLPVILVIDTVGMTRGIAPLLVGYQAFDNSVNIAGVILNKVGGARHESKLRAAVETYTGLAVVGSVWRNPALEIGERHLGLTTPAEMALREQLIAGFTDVVAGSVDLDRIRAISASAPELPTPATAPVTEQFPGLRIGLIRDAAFGFYYPDDLEAFEQAGATLVPINAIADTALPEIDGLFIGGGFPECRMDELAANTGLRSALRDALGAGLPAYAECGGLMYLCNSLTWDGETRPMVGLIDARAVMHARPQGRGHIVFTDSPDHPWGPCASRTQGHEFHYASLQGLAPKTRFARDMRRGHGVDGAHDGIVVANTLAGFCHLRNTGPSAWVPRFLRFVTERKQS